MSKKTEKAKRNKQIGTLTDKQKYEAKILEKDARIKELELELIIAKKWPPGTFGPKGRSRPPFRRQIGKLTNFGSSRRER
ncbi:hypothetical protein BTI09_08025 [Lactobacillus delbrueckii subsp. bulgaricus]|nr:hypothetical protein [Lactobacillus delbrueckii subsp. bulgaricus]